MSFQAYIDTIKARTGKDPQDFRALAEARGLLAPGVKTGQVVAWLKEDFGLGQGHAMALVVTFKAATEAPTTKDERIARLFSGSRAAWRETYERLLAELRAFGPGVSVAPTGTYLSLLRRGKKFGILQVTGDRLDVGIKLKGEPSTARLEPAGDWNSMVTHRVRVTRPEQVDAQVLGWLREAYDRA